METKEKILLILKGVIIFIVISAPVFFASRLLTENQIRTNKHSLYKEIYSKAYNQGKSSATKAFERSKNEIYQTGYDKGYADCKAEISKENKEQYNKGYEKGYDDASYIAGFSSLEEAYDDGYTFGTEEGYTEGYKEGYEECVIDNDLY